MIGRLRQRPPAYSAVHVAGQRAYALARRGQAPLLPLREVTVTAAELIDWQPPDLTLELRCGAGTYVRSWARDLGVAALSRAYVAQLRRLSIGPVLQPRCGGSRRLSPRSCAASGRFPAPAAGGTDGPGAGAIPPLSGAWPAGGRALFHQRSGTGSRLLRGPGRRRPPACRAAVASRWRSLAAGRGRRGGRRASRLELRRCVRRPLAVAPVQPPGGPSWRWSPLPGPRWSAAPRRSAAR